LKKSFVNPSSSYIDKQEKEKLTEYPLEENKEIGMDKSFEEKEEDVGDERDLEKERLVIPSTPGSELISKRILEAVKAPVKKATTAPALNNALQDRKSVV
jgi:hypothetical protein